MHVGHRGFTSDATNDNRGDGWMSHHGDNQSMYGQQAVDPYAWMGGYGGGYDPYSGMYSGYGGGYDPYGYGYNPYGYDPYGYGAYDTGTNTSMSGSAALDESWGEASQTTLGDLENDGAVHAYEQGSVLVIANGPEDMRKLDHNGEADMIAGAMGGERQTVVLWNPSADALQAMLANGQFNDVVLSGHGEQGTVYMTGADGKAVAVDASTFTGYFQDSGVQNVFLNMCHGAGGENSVAQSLAEAGMNVLGWQTSVSDDTAQNVAGAFGGLLADGTDVSDMQAAAQMDANLTVIEAQKNDPAAPDVPAVEVAAAGPTAEELAAQQAEATAQAQRDQLAQQQAEEMAAQEAARQAAISMGYWDSGMSGFQYY